MLVGHMERALAKYHGRLTSSEALHDLSTIALASALDTASIEATHATLRRALTGMSVQTHTMALLDVSSCEVLRHFRKLGKFLKGFFGECNIDLESTSGSGAVEIDQAVNVQAGGGGGAWRAFISEKTRCKAPADFAQLLRTTSPCPTTSASACEPWVTSQRRLVDSAPSMSSVRQAAFSRDPPRERCW